MYQLSILLLSSHLESIALDDRIHSKNTFPLVLIKLRRDVPRDGTPHELQSGASITRESGGIAITTHRQSLSIELWVKFGSAGSYYSLLFYNFFTTPFLGRFSSTLPLITLILISKGHLNGLVKIQKPRGGEEIHALLVEASVKTSRTIASFMP